MAEYIEREAALSAQNKSMNLAECRTRLERLPAADVVERKALQDKLIEIKTLEWVGSRFEPKLIRVIPEEVLEAL